MQQAQALNNAWAQPKAKQVRYVGTYAFSASGTYLRYGCWHTCTGNVDHLCCAFLLPQPTICLEINNADRSTALAVPVGRVGIISRVDYRYWLPATCALYLRPYRYNLSTFRLPPDSSQHRLQSPKKADYSLYCFTQQPSPPIDMYSFSDMYNWSLSRGIPRSSRG